MMDNQKSNSGYLMEVEDLKEHFTIRTGFMKTTLLKAVDGVSFQIKPGETLGLVGESGCGKTTVGRTLLHLYKPTGGRILFNGNEVNSSNIKTYRRKMQMVFQDPYSSLDPRMTVEDIIGEPLDVHKLYSSKGERRDTILELMSLVGLNAEHATRYVHEFSGGQRQRIGIARARKEWGSTPEQRISWSGRPVLRGAPRQVFAHPRHRSSVRASCRGRRASWLSRAASAPSCLFLRCV